MLRTLWTLLLVLALAQAAGAASLSVGTDKLTYAVGETVTVTVFGDDGPPSFGYPIVTYGIYGRLDYNGALVNTGTRSQSQLVGEHGNWIKGVLTAADTNVPGPGSFSEAFNTIPFQGNPDTALNLPGVVSILTLIAQATGVVSLSWHPNGIDGFGLNFFGLGTAPGATFTIVPEAGTGALLALGLLGLARLRRAQR